MKLKRLGFAFVAIGLGGLGGLIAVSYVCADALNTLHTKPINPPTGGFLVEAIDWLLFAALPGLFLIILGGGWQIVKSCRAGQNDSAKELK